MFRRIVVPFPPDVTAFVTPTRLFKRRPECHDTGIPGASAPVPNNA
jgi:hypothetical protein